MSGQVSGWTFLSNHAHVMLVLARDPDKRLRDIAAEVGITERAVQRIVSELLEVGAIHVERVGRRNHYQLNWELPLRHPLERDHTVGELLRTLAPTKKKKRRSGS
jgi:predicted ArsR family transcriptional regulator